MDPSIATLIATYVPVQYVGYATAAVTCASIIATRLPAPTSTKGVYPIVYGLLNVVALNVGKAKNGGGSDVSILASVAEGLVAATVHQPPAPPPTPAPVQAPPAQ